jgi:MFS family permease
MKPELPKGTRAERLAFARHWMRQRRADEPAFRLSRGRRRVIVVGLYLFLAATVSALVGGSGSPLPPFLGISSVTWLIWLFVTQFGCFMLLSYSVRGLLMADDSMDERERVLRDRATVSAYRILTGAIAILSLYAFVVVGFRVGLPVPSTGWHLLLLTIPLGWLAVSLPMSVLAWTLPDPEE